MKCPFLTSTSSSLLVRREVFVASAFVYAIAACGLLDTNTRRSNEMHERKGTWVLKGDLGVEKG